MRCPRLDRRRPKGHRRAQLWPSTDPRQELWQADEVVGRGSEGESDATETPLNLLLSWPATVWVQPKASSIHLLTLLAQKIAPCRVLRPSMAELRPLRFCATMRRHLHRHSVRRPSAARLIRPSGEDSSSRPKPQAGGIPCSICPKPAITLFRKDWHSRRAVL
jgi:hypothetical protein